MSLADWSRARESRESAKSKLDELPSSVTNHGVSVPFKVGNKKAYKSKHSNREINLAIESAPIRVVPLDRIVAIQHSVKPEKVEEYINNPVVPAGRRDRHHGGLTDFPIVIQQDGVLYAHDGHHRLTAAKLNGDTSSPARFVDFDKGQ